MLKGFDNRPRADVLYALHAMEHGNLLVVCDPNFPADSIARHTDLGEPLHMENLTAAQALEAILPVLPLDTFVEDRAARMEILGRPDVVPPAQVKAQNAIDRAGGLRTHMVGVECFDFYDRARTPYTIIQTGESRYYGCFTFCKGVIPPEE